MKFVTVSGKESQTAKLDGYTIGHRTSRNGPNERDLEGVNFTLNADGADSIGELEVSSDSEHYLEKFADWEDKIREAVKTGGDGEDLGLHHPETGEILFINEVPDYIRR